MTSKPKPTSRARAARSATAIKGKSRKPEEPPTPKSRRLEIQLPPGKTEDRVLTDLLADGEVTNASLTLRFAQAEHGEGSLTDMVASLREQGEAVNRGDLSATERMLNAQAVALNTIFAEMARRAVLNMGTHLGAMETYLRLALKAQAQSRATAETIAAIKNPPVVFARQANINNGGQQQVNNCASENKEVAGTSEASAHAGDSHSRPNELLEGLAHGRTQLDTGATQAAGRTHHGVETVGALNRPAYG